MNMLSVCNSRIRSENQNTYYNYINVDISIYRKYGTHNPIKNG